MSQEKSALRTVVTKSRSCGCSWGSEAHPEPGFKYLHLVAYCHGLGAAFEDAVIIGQHRPVRLSKQTAMQNDEPFDIFVPGKRLADIVDPESPIFFVRIGKEEDFFKGECSGSQIEQFSGGMFPNSMKLSFDQDFAPLPDCPAEVLYSAVSSNVLWHDAEAFQQWLVGRRLTRHPYRICTADAATE